MNEMRRHARETVILNGRVTSTDGCEDVLCDIVDISAGGARVKFAAILPTGTDVTLCLGDFGNFSARVQWSRPPHLGLKFHDSPDTMAEVMMAMALYG